jgi:hypothetical protein
MGRTALTLSLALSFVVTAPAIGQDAVVRVDPAGLMRTAMGKSETAQDARNALRELAAPALMPFKDKIVANLATVRRTCEVVRMDRVKAIAKRSRSANEGRVKQLRSKALKLISTYTKAQQGEVDKIVDEIKSLIYVSIPNDQLQTEKIRTAMYGWYLFRDLAIKTGALAKSDPMPYIAITLVDDEGKLRAWMTSGWEKTFDAIDDIPDSAVFPEEKNCIKATNRYRMLMGKSPDACDPKLVLAGRAHSTEMKKLGFFAHESPTPENRTFGKRASKAGTSASSENIAQGQATGQAAFDGWYHSPGHHRNILGSHGRTGVGTHQRYWTQMFG